LDAIVTIDLTDETGVFRRAIPPWGIRATEGERVVAKAVDHFVVRVMSLDLLTTVLLQRIYLGVSITLATHLVAMGILLLWGRLRFSAVRLCLYWLCWGGAVVMQMLSGNAFSSASVALGLVCYVSFLVVIPAGEATYFGVIRTYQAIALGVCGMVFLDLAVQVAGFSMPDMNAVVPASLTPPTMNYIQPLTWHAGIIKPNAFFMMEASYTSQFIAIALVIELVFFQRGIWIAIFALGLLGTFSGTGLLMFLLALPCVATRFWKKLLRYGLILLPLLSVIAVASGWYEIASQRATTFDKRNTSANGRFVAPFTAMYDLLASDDEHKIIFGYGAGKTSDQELVPGLDPKVEYNAISKVLLDYGIVIAILLLIFSTYCLFGSGVPVVIAYVAALEYHLMGGHLLLPPILNYCCILTSGWEIHVDKSAPFLRASKHRRCMIET
jgi:hypothetical protein